MACSFPCFYICININMEVRRSVGIGYETEKGSVIGDKGVEEVGAK